MSASMIDKEEFVQLVTRHPGWSCWQLARALTLHNLLLGRTQGVTVEAVKKARSRNRDMLRAKGVHVRGAECRLVAELKKRTGTKHFPQEQSLNSQLLRRLRQLDRIERGLGIQPRERSGLASWEASLRDRKYVIDVIDGVPYTRPAGPGELVKGELKAGGVGLLAAGRG